MPSLIKLLKANKPIKDKHKGTASCLDGAKPGLCGDDNIVWITAFSVQWMRPSLWPLASGDRSPSSGLVTMVAAVRRIPGNGLKCGNPRRGAALAAGLQLRGLGRLGNVRKCYEMYFCKN